MLETACPSLMNTERYSRTFPSYGAGPVSERPVGTIIAPMNNSGWTELLENTTQVAKTIHSLPNIRHTELRKPSTVLKLDQKKANLEAALGHERGSEPPAPCVTCTKTSRPVGPFKKCVVVNGQFDGACCNYMYNDQGSGCSLQDYYSTTSAGKTTLCYEGGLRS
ncbi:hypothetical protein BDZ45DRAFT_108585 [Acephala macrosclerotiorum]|nr:hypothetical protein BDZ45DRAFT_108585 [Acephala macrosclerotiorum]